MGLEDPGFNERPWRQEGNTAEKEAITAWWPCKTHSTPRVKLPLFKKTKNWNEWVCSSLDRLLA